LHRYLRVLISLAAGVVILWLVTRGQDLEGILREFRNADYLWILLAALAAILSHALRALRWNQLIASMGYPVSPFKTFQAVMAGYLSNLAVPRLGEVTRCLVLQRAGRPPLNALLGTVVAERLFDMLTLGMLVVLTIAFQYGFLRDFLEQYVVTPLMAQPQQTYLVLALAALGALILLIALFVYLKHRWREAHDGSIGHRIKRQLAGLRDGVAAIRRIRSKPLFVFYSLAIWASYFLTVYLVFFALEATSHLTVGAGIILLAMGSLGIVVPVPGGIGTYHFLAMITLTELYAIAPEPAISYAYISHATQILVIVLAGSVAWLAVSLRQHGNGTASPGTTT